MQSLLAQPKTDPGRKPNEAASKNHWIWAALIVGFFFALQLCWLMLDTQSPDMDESNHILSSIQCAEFLRKPRLLRPDWWHQWITVNAFYPPAMYMFNGALRSVLGTANWVNIASISFFNILLSASAFGITRYVSQSKLAPLMAVALVNLYPGIVAMNHTFLLDYPLISMVAVGLFSLLWWNNSPSWKRAAVCSLLCGIAFTTKQIAPAFIAGPALYLFVVGTIKAFRGHSKAYPLQLMVAMTGSLAMFGIWYLLSASAVQGLANHNVEHIGSRSLFTYFSQNLSFYLNGAPRVMSPLLFGAFVIALLSIKPKEHLILIPVGFSAVLGLVMVSCIGWAMPLDRYQAPLLVAVAAYTAVGLSTLAGRSFKLLNIGLVALFALAILQLISFEFCPYPLSQSQWLTELSQHMGVTVKGYRTDYKKDNPGLPGQDWGQAWVIRTVQSVDGNNPAWLNLQVNSSELNPHTLELYAKQMGGAVRPTSSRVWTCKGDKQTFSEKEALYYQWYLLKNDRLGNPFEDQADRLATEQLFKFVTAGGHFRLVASKTMPDRSTIMLYRQI